MNIKDTLEETYTALSANKVRSGLTILGIVIGISSVIALVSIGAGASSSITSRIESLGSNLILVTPGAARNQGFGVSTGRGAARSLTMTDVNSIGTGVTGVRAVTAEVSGRYQVTAKGTNTNTTVDGVTSTYPQIRNLEISDGAFIDDTQNDSIAKVAVVGPTVVTDLFGVDAISSDAIGQIIRIKGIQFTIIGVTVAKGGTGFSSPDDMIYIPITSAQRYLSGNQYVNTIDVQAENPSVMTQAQEDITNLLLTNHHISDPAQADFSALNQNDILSTASSVTDTLTYLLGAIAGISLIVGGIGIMNMMLTTVTERTREIGLRKAIGAKKADISKQFLIEATILTLIGGIIGIILGWSISFIVNATGILSTSVSLSSIFLAFGVSAIIGIVFGYYPARRASRLSPIEALRYE
ncbi:MAG: ABC transporter permease [Patescibacteria group bacterium]